MRDGQDRHSLAFDDEEHPEREAMKNRSPNLTNDDRELQRSLLNAHERRAKLIEEFCPEATALTLIPRASLLDVEFCLRPNVEPGHLWAGAETVLNSLDDFPPWPRVAWRLTMRGEPFLQQGLLPLVKGHLIDAGGNAVPQRLHVVDLVFDRQGVEPRRR